MISSLFRTSWRYEMYSAMLLVCKSVLIDVQIINFACCIFLTKVSEASYLVKPRVPQSLPV